MLCARGFGDVTIEQFGLGDPRIREFVRIAWDLHRDDPLWTPPLNADLLGNRLLGTVGLLTAAHPYHEEATVTHFIARRGGRAVGRVSGAVNHRYNTYHGTKIGSFGFFDSIADDAVAGALLDAVRDWIVAQGMEFMRGPGEYSNATHERQGVLIDGFDYPPTVELTHNQPYYAGLLERWGLSKVKDYHASRIMLANTPIDRIHGIASKVRTRDGLTVRAVDMKRFTEEVRTVIDIYNDAWSANWGFLPITPGEADSIADTLKPIVDPGLIRFACRDDEPVAVLGAFPDPNWALLPRRRWYGDSDVVRIARLLAMRRHIPRVRLMFFGIRSGHRRSGIDAVLFEDVYRYAVERGYREVEASMLLEENDLVIRAAASMGGHVHKTWRIYERSVSQP